MLYAAATHEELEKGRKLSQFWAVNTELNGFIKPINCSTTAILAPFYRQRLDVLARPNLSVDDTRPSGLIEGIRREDAQLATVTRV